MFPGSLHRCALEPGPGQEKLRRWTWRLHSRKGLGSASAISLARWLEAVLEHREVGTHMSHPGWVQVTQVVAELSALRCVPVLKCQARSLLVPEVLQGAKTTLRLARGEWCVCSVLWNWVPVL